MLYFERQTVCFLLLIVAVLSSKECDQRKCKGPVRFYEELRCKPIYKRPGDCCAIRYDCSHLSRRSKDKCYINGHEYAIGDRIKDEDRSHPCDVGCTCMKGDDEKLAIITCAVVDCWNWRVKEGCYFRRKFDTCCDGEEVCPKSPDDRKKCIVDGKVYLEGEAFFPKGTNLHCACTKDYKGKNIAPFCRKITCAIELRSGLEIYRKCAPVFYSNESPSTSCGHTYRCQNKKDIVIPRSSNSDNIGSDNMMCKFGNMTMRIGDELNQGTEYSSKCVKCVCEVPPVPTCQRLKDSECA